MGTPGDKKEIGKVVGHPWPPDQIQQSTQQQQQQHIQQLLPTTSAATSSSLSSTVILTSPSSLTSSTQFDTILPHICTRSTEMGYSSPTVFHPINPLPSSSSSSSPIIVKSEEYPPLEQATIEDYFTQSKYYSTISTEGSDFNPDQPGPSGLQSSKKGKKPLSKSGGKKYECPICQKHFTTSDKLSKHQQIHTNQSPFKCDQCKKVFTSKFKLVRHALIHSDRKPFSCTVCERTFHRKDHLKNHIKVHSPSKKVYTCDKVDCRKEYTSLLSYRKHLAIHAAEEGNLKCQICSVTFQTKQEILYHLKVHAGSRTVKNPSEKKFVCDTCGRRFFTKKDVRRHSVVHTGLREFLCQFCPQRFGRKDHLVRHIKKSHNKNYQSSESVESIKKEPVSLDMPSTSLSTSLDQVPDIKTEYFEGTDPDDLELPNLFVDQTLFLPSSSELRDLGGAILEEIEPMSSTSTAETATEISTLHNPELEQLFQGTSGEEKNVKLPAFSKTFQPPPPS